MITDLVVQRQAGQPALVISMNRWGAPQVSSAAERAFARRVLQRNVFQNRDLFKYLYYAKEVVVPESSAVYLSPISPRQERGSMGSSTRKFPKKKNLSREGLRGPERPLKEGARDLELNKRDPVHANYAGAQNMSQNSCIVRFGERGRFAVSAVEKLSKIHTIDIDGKTYSVKSGRFKKDGKSMVLTYSAHSGWIAYPEGVLKKVDNSP